MKVFLSWSGKRSHAVADALGPWMKQVVQSVEPWISSDMDRGVKWLDVVNKSLDEHSFGILCVTPGNVAAPWLNYEAGALAKQLGDGGRVIPYLLDFRSESDLKQPLAQFNACVANKYGTWTLVKTLNNHAEFALKDEALKESFELWWPKLESNLAAISSTAVSREPPRDEADKVDELLQLTRIIKDTIDRQQIEAGTGRTASDILSEAIKHTTEEVTGSTEFRSMTLIWPRDRQPRIELQGPLTVQQLERIASRVLVLTGIDAQYAVQDDFRTK